MEDLDEDNISIIYRKVVANSVAFMMMERLGIDTEEYFFREDFEDIVNFNTPQTLNALGFATSDIAEMGLAEIAKTVMSREKQNRIIAENQNPDYNIVKENQTERSLENDRTDLHDAGRLDSTNSGRTSHPLAQFALKLCNGLTLSSDCPYVTDRVSDYTFFSQTICVGIKPINKNMRFRLYLVVGQIHYLPIYYYKEHLFLCQELYRKRKSGVVFFNTT